MGELDGRLPAQNTVTVTVGFRMVWLHYCIVMITVKSVLYIDVKLRKEEGQEPKALKYRSPNSDPLGPNTWSVGRKARKASTRFCELTVTGRVN